MAIDSKSAAVICVLPPNSATYTGPTRASSGRLSMLSAPSIKCEGASTWVPVCDPSERTLTVAESPLDKSLRKSNLGPGSPSYVGMSGRNGTEMS